MRSSYIGKYKCNLLASFCTNLLLQLITLRHFNLVAWKRTLPEICLKWFEPSRDRERRKIKRKKFAKLKLAVKWSKEICAICIISVLLLEARREIIILTDVCFKDIVKFKKLLLYWLHLSPNWWSRKIMLETEGKLYWWKLSCFQSRRRRTIAAIGSNNK